jgi:putative ABC transport system permease protein
VIAATMKSLLSRKLRLLLSGLAVVLGVMAVSGAFVVTDSLSRSFDTLFDTAFAELDVQVTGPQYVDDGERGGEPVTEPVPAALVDEVAAVPGVSQAAGNVFVDGARVVGKDGKLIGSRGPPRFGTAWRGEVDMVELRSGRGPSTPDEIAVNAGLAKAAGFRLGDRVDVLTLEPKQTFTLVGIFGYSGDRDSFGGETRVAFTPAVAQRLMLGEEGVFSEVVARASDGASQEQLRDRVAAAVGSHYTVRTGEQVADDQAAGIATFLDIIRNVLLGFAGVALLVGTFLILNTFSILVAQRTGELALFRALGASRRQLIASVLLEATIIGVVAATLGLFAGVGLGALLQRLIESQGNSNLPGSGASLPLVAVVASYSVGLLVTLAAALVPAVRASRIAPVAAMRSVSAAERPLTVLSLAGALLAGVGSAAVGTALWRDLGDTRLAVLLGGVVAVFVGVAMLTPLVTRPVVGLLGRGLAWSVPGQLGRRNSARNPRRTAVTAAALMIGMALVTGVSVLAGSLKASIEDLVQQDLGADLVIAAASDGRSAPKFDPRVVDEAAQLPAVDQAVTVYTDVAQLDASAVPVMAGDVGALVDVFRLQGASGELRTLRAGEVVIDSAFAMERGLDVGDRLELATSRAGDRSYTVVGTHEPSELVSGPVLSVADARTRFTSSQAAFGYVTVESGADVPAVKASIAKLLASQPEVTVDDRSGFVAQQSAQVDTITVMLYALLGLALVIAVLGIVNTLALSILERTRELGLVRAVGMRRGQVAGMVAVESVVISVFGALLGLLVGSGLGAAVVGALDEDIPVLSIPWATLGVFVAIAAVAGVAAALLPAVRAARVDVLKAIAYE